MEEIYGGNEPEKKVITQITITKLFNLFVFFGMAWTLLFGEVKLIHIGILVFLIWSEQVWPEKKPLFIVEISNKGIDVYLNKGDDDMK